MISLIFHTIDGEEKAINITEEDISVRLVDTTGMYATKKADLPIGFSADRKLVEVTDTFGKLNLIKYWEEIQKIDSENITKLEVIYNDLQYNLYDICSMSYTVLYSTNIKEPYRITINFNKYEIL